MMGKSTLNIFLILTSFNFISCEENIEIIEEVAPVNVSLKAGLIIEKANYYVSPNGNDANPGTLEKPFKSWDKIIDVVKPGDLVYLRGGTYYHSNRRKGCASYLVGKNGMAGQYIRLWAYPGEKPVLDCKNMPLVSTHGIYLSANYWHIKGVEVKNIYQSSTATTSTMNRGISIKNANFNIIENVVVHNIEGIGLSMSERSTKNIIKNSDFYDNYDKLTYKSTGQLYPGGNADGVHLMAYKGSTNTIRGCRFYNNSDDGLDLWENEGIMVIDSCWSFNNGYDKGDGNGFKLGRTLQSRESFPQRIVTHCISFGNRGIGYDQNNANVTMVFYNNVAFANKSMGFYIAKYNLKNIVCNNISLSNGYKDLFTSESIITNNSWNGYTISTSVFLNTNSKELKNSRSSNGRLPKIDFLVLNSISILIDKGKNVGFPYLGVAPDIGVFESR